MNRLNQLTVKSLKMNKKRTMMTIFGIILSTALICALAGLVTSVQKTMMESAREDYGNYHAGFKGVLKENLKYVTENRNVEDFFCIEGLGYSALSESENPDKPYLYLQAFDEKAMENTGLELLEGRMPENGDEVVIAESILTNGKVDYQVGDILSLSVSERELDGVKLGQNNPYHRAEDLEESEVKETERNMKVSEETEATVGKEILVEKFQKDYTIVGIVKRPNYTIEEYSAPGYSVITKMDTVSEKADIYVNFEKIKKANEYAIEIQEVLKQYQNWELEPKYNRELLRWSGSIISGSTRSLLYGTGAIVILIIMVSSIFVIRNSFAISIMERMKQYGMLASIGATSQQIRKNVLFEAFLLGVTAIPGGILSGIFAVFVLIQIVNELLKDSLNIKLCYSMSVMPVLMAVVLSMATIYLSAFSSARKAAKISPLEAIRSNQDIKITAKKIRAPKVIKKCFGVGGEIAYKNLKRSRKKYRTTVISMVVSIVLFLSMYSFIQYGFRYSGAYYKTADYNLSLYLLSDGYLEEIQKIYQDLTGLEGILAWSIVRENAEYFLKEDYLSKLGQEISEYKYGDMDTEDETGEQKKTYCKIVSLGEEAYEDYLKSLGVKQIGENGVILIENGYHYIQRGNKTEQMFGSFYNLKEGDEITAVSEAGKELSMNIVKVTQEKPMGLQGSYRDEGYFVINDKWMDQIGYQSFQAMRIQAEEPYVLEEKIEERIKDMADHYALSNLEEQIRRENSMVLVIEIFLYGFITVITLIGVTNIFNTVTTNVNLREKEFAMLRSVGMTQKEFSGMIRLESIFYGAKALITGLPVGTICSFLIFRVINNNMEMTFELPWRAYLLIIVFVLLIVGLTMKYSFSKIKNRNIIETIRKDTV